MGSAASSKLQGVKDASVSELKDSVKDLSSEETWPNCRRFCATWEVQHTFLPFCMSLGQAIVPFCFAILLQLTLDSNVFASQETAMVSSPEEKEKVLCAISLLELAELAGRYHASASNGDWGDYSIHVTIDSAAMAVIRTSACFFRDSPAEIAEHKGPCSLSGDVLTIACPEARVACFGLGVEANRILGAF